MTIQTEVPKVLVSKRECANALSLSVRTIENLIARKELTVRRVGRRTLVLASSLAAFARRDHASPSPAKRGHLNEAHDGDQQSAL
jgi:excisionase family DNA binding protein